MHGNWLPGKNLRAAPHLFRLLLLFLCASATAGAQNVSGITGVRDTSFSIAGEYRKLKPKYPELAMVEPVPGALIRTRGNITYCRRGTRALQLDAFLPLRKGRGRAAVLIIHGGGWRSGDRSQHHALAQRLAALGYVCFTPEYRLSTEALYPAAVHDLKAALRWIRSHARSYGIDSNRIAVLGFSAGGELAAFLATTQNEAAYEGEGCNRRGSTTVNALIDIDGTLSFVHSESGEGDDSKRTSAATYWFGFPKKEAYTLWEDASPLTHAGAHTPPTLFLNSSVARMHAGRDDFIRVLQAHNIYSEVREFPDAPHPFPLFHPWFEPVVTEVDSFLKKVFVP